MPNIGNRISLQIVIPCHTCGRESYENEPLTCHCHQDHKVKMTTKLQNGRSVHGISFANVAWWTTDGKQMRRWLTEASHR